MALLTPLDPASAREILDAYGFELVSLEPLAAGSVNSNFFLNVRAAGGEETTLFARIFEEQAASGALFELELNEALAAAGIPVARPVKRLDGTFLAVSGKKPFALYERLSGDVTCQRGVTRAIAHSVGRALASVHVAPLGSLEVPPTRFGFSGIRERLKRVLDAQRPDLVADVERLLDLSTRLERERSTDLPSGLIHGDLFRDNVLVREEKVIGLLDFESASYGPYVYDLLVTILAWCFGDGLESALARAMVEGYVDVRPLSTSERAAMIGEGSVACLRFATTRLTDFSLRVPVGQKPGRDYRRFFSRLESLQAGELTAALEGLFQEK